MNQKSLDTPYSLGVLIQILAGVLMFLGWGRFTDILSPWISIALGGGIWVLVRISTVLVWSRREFLFPDPFIRMFSFLFVLQAIGMLLSAFLGLGLLPGDRDNLVAPCVLLLIPTAIVGVQNILNSDDEG